jgi:hypothetical protein
MNVVITIVITATVVIPVIELRPAGPVGYPHTEVSIVIILVTTFITTVVLLFYLGIFILRLSWRKIHVIGRLTGLVSGGATAENSNKKCQK